MFSNSNLAEAFRKRKVRTIVSNTIFYIFTLLLLVFFLFPYLYMLVGSFSYDQHTFNLPITFLPKEWSLKGYERAFSPEMVGYHGNTLLIIVLNLIAVPLSSSLCAYGFAKLRFVGRNVIFAVMMATVMLPSTVLSIPLYLIYVNMGWIDTFYPLWFPNLFGGGAMNIFLLVQFMKGVPKDIENAARIDGANDFIVYGRIILPMCVPVLIYIMTGVFLGTWNDFSGALLYLKSKEKYTLGIGLYYKFISQDYEANLLNFRMAVGLIMSLVPAIIYFCCQKQLERSINLTGAATKG